MTHTLSATETYVQLEPRDAVNATIIWLHGLGADAHDFVDIVPALNVPTTRFIFPNAPVRPITLNGGYRMRAWYDIRSSVRIDDPDHEGLNETLQHVHTLLDDARLALPNQKLFLAGFSQGGAVALDAGLRYPHPLTGIFALSTYLPRMTEWTKETPSVQHATPIWMGHGTQDAIVPLTLGMQSRDLLCHAGYTVEFHTYDMAHQVCPAEIADIRASLHRLSQ